MPKAGRNDPCPCGSGKKYKHCCLRNFASETATAEPAKTSSISQALEIALAHHSAGRLEQAEAIYREILRVAPNSAEALHLLGVIFHERGINDEAVALIDRAIAVDPRQPRYYSNRGTALGHQGKVDDAIASFQRAIAMNPNFADAHYNLGWLLQTHNRTDEAIASFQKAVRLDPEKYGHTQHLVAAYRGKTTERPPVRYVEKLFDDYANTFDEQLVQHLGYKLPKQLVALLGQTVELPAAQWDVLDLGCGTGLSGMEMSPHARRLVGVDLSTKMLAKARARNIYHRLDHSDLLPMMRGEEASCYDVIVASDVLEYLGRLDDIVLEAKRLLRPGGFFIFSVEALGAQAGDAADSDNGPDYALKPSGRYAHTAGYLKKLARDHSLDCLHLVSIPLRLEKGLPLLAWAAVWRG